MSHWQRGMPDTISTICEMISSDAHTSTSGSLQKVSLVVSKGIRKRITVTLKCLPRLELWASGPHQEVPFARCGQTRNILP